MYRGLGEANKNVRCISIDPQKTQESNVFDSSRVGFLKPGSTLDHPKSSIYLVFQVAAPLNLISLLQLVHLSFSVFDSRVSSLASLNIEESLMKGVDQRDIRSKSSLQLTTTALLVGNKTKSAFNNEHG